MSSTGSIIITTELFLQLLTFLTIIIVPFGHWRPKDDSEGPEANRKRIIIYNFWTFLNPL